MRTQYVIMTVAATLAIQGCAHGQLEKRIDEKVAQETQVKTRADVSEEAKESIERASGLTQDQRSQLLSLRESTHAQMDRLINQSLRLRAVLVKDLISTAYDEDEVQLIKRKIRDVEKQRVSEIFDATDQANRILGREAVNNRKVLDEMFEPHGHYN